MPSVPITTKVASSNPIQIHQLLSISSVKHLIVWCTIFVGKILSVFCFRIISYFSRNVINIALIICFIKLCLLLFGDIEQNPGSTQGDTTRTLQSSISICHLNMTSLRNKIDDIVHIGEDFDIVCFTEAFLDQRVPSNELVIPGFNSNPFRLDRNMYGGGIRGGSRISS